MPRGPQGEKRPAETIRDRLRAATMRRDLTKTVAHYVIARSVPEKLGATKLNKSMWIADVLSFLKTGRTISGQTSYKKLQYGPVPNNIVRYITELIEEGK